MHQEAIVDLGITPWGGKGNLVNIQDLEKHYKTSQAANAGITYCCANPNCNIPVKAVITMVSKLGRKKSPSPYFHAKYRKQKHVIGCSHFSISPTVTTAISGGTQPASPNRKKAPAIWIDPLNPTVNVVGGGGGTAATNSSNSSSSNTRGMRGNNTSKGQSKKVEVFAKEWLQKNVPQQKLEPLIAPWNTEGTYYSAFHSFYPTAGSRSTSVSAIGRKIYIGMVANITKNASDFIITLQVKDSTGAPLKIHVQQTAFQCGSPSNALSAKLNGLVNPTNHQVFALGDFVFDASGEYILSVQHPHYIYIS